MDILWVFQGVIILLLIISIVLIFKSKQSNNPQEQILKKFKDNELAIREEFGMNRDETNKTAQSAREELTKLFTQFTQLIDNKIQTIREELTSKINDLTKETAIVFEKNRETIEKKLKDIQENNNNKLEEMRRTVDEKLHDTLEKRLTESFKVVSDNLDRVQKGLGEMQSLAIGVGDLKKVLSNVKAKGVLGEYQLAAILEQVLAPNQYAVNVKIKANSKESVEFAIKIPSNEDINKHVWLPIDSKFPTVDYENLMTAYDMADIQAVERSQKELESKIKKFAKDIRDKYIDPPNTTEFAIMFLPFEGLYAEVLRIPNLFQSIHNELRISIASPTTISAFLNSLQMGFRGLAVEKRTSEIWSLLGAVKTEFGKFAGVLEATKKKLDSASEELAKTGTRSRQIEKQLKDVQTLPEPETRSLLGTDFGNSDSDE